MFGGHPNIVTDIPTEGDAVTLSVVNYDGVLREGQVIMPMFAALSNTLLYNIHDVTAPRFNEDNKASIDLYIEGCLNFFNAVVRDGRGMSRVVWRDPIMLDTKLQKHTYDEMFTLHVLGAYLERVDPSYEKATSASRLTKCLSCMSVLQEDCKSIKVEIVVQERLINEHWSAATPTWPLKESSFVPEDNPVLQQNIGKHYCISILAFLKLSGVIKSRKFSLYLIGRFGNYSFMEDIAKIYKGVTFHVWCKETDALPKGIDVIRKDAVPRLPSTNYKGSFMVTLLPSDKLISDFEDGQVLTLTSETFYKPSRIIMPLFRDESAGTYSIVSPENDKLGINEVTAIRRSANLGCAIFNSLYRDTRKYVYAHKNKRGSYDDIYKMAIESNIMLSK